MLNSKLECWIVNLNFGGDITLYRRGRQVVFVKLDSPGHAGPALSLPGTFVNKKYIYPKHAFPPPPNTAFRPQTPLFAPNTAFHPPNTPLAEVWPKYANISRMKSWPSNVWKRLKSWPSNVLLTLYLDISISLNSLIVLLTALLVVNMKR